MTKKLEIRFKKNYLMDVKDEGLKIENMNFVDFRYNYGKKISEEVFECYSSLKDRRRNHYEVLILDKRDLKILQETKKINLGNNTLIFLNNLEEIIEE